MATITEDYVSFETAKLLKEKGFDVKYNECYAYFADDDIRVLNLEYQKPAQLLSENRYPCITLQMAMKWLREVHNIHISVYVFNRELPITDVPISYTCDIATKKLSSQQGHLRGVWQSYEQAVEAAIIYCLENLI